MLNSLLAKSPENPHKPKPAETLVGHTELVCQTADLLTAELAPFMRDMLDCSQQDIEYWRQSVWIAAWMHDWGKANSHFQKMLLDIGFKQGVRHETISLSITRELNDWLAPLWLGKPDWVKAAAVFAVSGHHLKFPDPLSNERPGTSVTVYLEHTDFHTLLELGKRRYALSEIPKLNDLEYSLLTFGNPLKNLKKIVRQYRCELTNDFNDYEKTLIATVNATVMSADLAGSALPSKVNSFKDWLQERLGKVLTEKQLYQVVDTKLKGSKPRPFQELVLNAASKTVLVEAGCGSGKTAAAYLWAARHADGKRLFFCYPTTATASEGFSGYLYEPDFDALLIHGRAKTDYEMLPNMPKPNKEEINLRLARLEALETWPVPAVVCTTHTVLGILENVRRGLYAWPSLARAVFVFDEVHAFSERLFSYLLRFLKAFSNTPVLLMTATLPPNRKSALENICQTRGRLEVITGPKTREEAKRYQMHKFSRVQAWDLVKEKLRQGKKVLWVCNTVSRAMEVADKAQAEGLPVKLYHSRYRYKDRLKHQRQVIDGFLPQQPAMLAVTTQVAEMSLDLSADLLVSEYAPVPAMIQRMGRLNRFEEIPQDITVALFIEPENCHPYTFKDKDEEEKLWAEIKDWLQYLCDDKPKSQRELSQAFIKVTAKNTAKPEPVNNCSFLDGLWETRKDERTIEEASSTVEVIMEEDIKEQKPVNNAIPMSFPYKHDWHLWRREGRYLVAPAGSIDYDFFRGALWKND